MVNKVILIGNLGANAETKTFDNGQSLVSLRLATSENYKDKNGEWQSKTQWHTVAIRGRAAERAAQLQKGARIYVEGSIEYREYEKDGIKRYATNINCFTFRSLDKRDEAASTQQAAPQRHPSASDEPLPF